MKKINDTGVSRNPTLKTLSKVRMIIRDIDGAFSIGALYDKSNINYYSLEPCIQELLKNQEIIELNSTTKARLFLKK